jgi:hypothetical protein
MKDCFDPDTLPSEYVRQYFLERQSLAQTQATELQKYQEIAINESIGQ